MTLTVSQGFGSVGKGLVVAVTVSTVVLCFFSIRESKRLERMEG